jgi:phosphoglycerol transferase MdoB-like AlkP superfamily enzyme
MLRSRAGRKPYDAIDPSRYLEEYIPAISNSQAMQYLKSLGYTTIVFNEHPVGFLPFQADIVHVDPDADSFTWNSPFNDFGVLVMDSTMVRPILAAVHVTDAGVIAHAKRLLYIEQNVTQPDVPSPKFVYVHVLLPHSPFMFDENGNFIPLEDQYDWDKYLGMYIYSIRTAERMIADILASRSGGREVVIILQSDHGARNFQNDTDSILLENFPAHFSYSIVNAIRMPGCDESVLAQDFDPINTFPVIFNCYFNAEVPLQ